ncbi:gamma-glutamyltransferase family protein [Phenylobacterium sp. VNQ135]|uniref:gamma-glutamyltransferase family protein n=1 Tax=Phenylobacterium sp. VNQ135 TaxID=3400922 RepID=UPI003BFD14BA
MTTQRADRGMTTAPHHLAAEVGRDVLAAGGSAVEASVAMAATLAVVYPHMTGIGGDGFWLVHEPDGQVRAIHGCGRAAAAADLGLYGGLKEIPTRGGLAANTVAGTVSAWAAVLAASGSRWPLEELLAPAIRLARSGVPATAGGAQVARDKGPELRAQPGAYAEVFEPEGRPLREGDVLKQPRLADTLEALARDGPDSFYRGELAAAMAADLAALGSPLAPADLADHQAETPTPLRRRALGAELFNTAPPTQGLTSLMILALFERLGAGTSGAFDHVHGLVEATKQAFLVRDGLLGDPAGMPRAAQDLLDDDRALDEMAARISPQRALPWPHRGPAGDTTWFAAADVRGQVVSAIQSTYFEFGSGLVLPQTGVVWQNRGSSFRLGADGPNALRPGRQPFHTLNPALARFDDGRLMAYGTMGGEGQPQTQAAIFTRYACLGMDLQEAISAPRWLLGRTWGQATTTLKLEDGFTPDLISALRAAGHDVEVLPRLSAAMGHAGAIVRHPHGVFEGASDPRSDGAAVGVQETSG